MTDYWIRQIDQTWSERNGSEIATHLTFEAGNDNNEEYMVEGIRNSAVYISTFHKHPAEPKATPTAQPTMVLPIVKAHQPHPGHQTKARPTRY